MSARGRRRDKGESYADDEQRSFPQIDRDPLAHCSDSARLIIMKTQTTADGKKITMAMAHCECGDATGERCEWCGPATETVEVEYMPRQHRASHDAFGVEGLREYQGTELGARRAAAAIARRGGHGWKPVVREA